MTENTPSPEVAPVRAGEELDWEAVVAYIGRHMPDLSGPLSVGQFPNGNANLTYLVRFGDRELVLRRPPFGHIAPGAHDMRREYRVLSRLWRTYDRAPRAYLFCDDETVVGSDFFVMERRVGEVVLGIMPSSMTHHTDVARRVGFSVADALADLHVLSPASCGLEDLGRPDGFLARQLTRWRERWDLARPAEAPSIMDEVASRLEWSMPESQRSSLLHNDLKLDNCQFDPDDPDRVSSVFDWDMATIGDPLVDLGTLLSYWPDPYDPPEVVRTTHGGMTTMGLPRRAEIVERYASRSGVDVEEVAWYEAFAQWKTAIVVQQLYNRFLRGETNDARMEEVGKRMPLLASGAAAILKQMTDR